MLRILFPAVLCVCLLAPAAAPVRAPVLIELFTSEGCSSCPPADRLLAELDSHAIVLGEHVDYWDHQGWRDPFSSHANTLRQESYARHFGIEGPHTPQMVVDGVAQFNGAESKRALEEIALASAKEKAVIHLARVAAGMEVRVDSVPKSVDVMLAFALEGGASQVTAGENRGRNLRHVAMLRSLRKIGGAKKGVGFHRLVELPAGAASDRVIVFAQGSDMGRVYGVALLEK